MKDALERFCDFMGTGTIMIWFLLSLIYLFLREKRKPRRILFVYLPVIVLLLYFNPLFAEGFNRLVEPEVYFRFCWLLPIIAVIAYSAVTIFEGLKGRASVCFGAAVLALILFSGKLVYSSPLYSRAENLYHVPDSVVHICDAIEVPGREVMALFPRELILYVRQYSALVCMPYGREVTKIYDPMDALVNSEVIDLEELVPMTRQRQCHYAVFRQEQKFKGVPADYGWEVFLETDGYVVYRDTEVELIIPEVAVQSLK